MHIIEQLLGIAPDHGDGSLEIMLFVSLLVVLGVVYFIRRRARQR